MLLAVNVLLIAIVPLTSDDAVAQGVIHVAEGDTLVIDVNTDIDAYYIWVEGTLVIDGADVATMDRRNVVDDTFINVTGRLRIVNGSHLFGYYYMDVHSGGVVEIIDSEISTSSRIPYTFHLEDAFLDVSGSTVECHRFVQAESSNISLRSTAAHENYPYYPDPWLNLTEGCNLVIEHTNVSWTSHLVNCEGVGNVSIQGSSLSTTRGNILTADGVERVAIENSSFNHGDMGVQVGDVGNISIIDSAMVGQEGASCHISWAENVTVDGISIEDCDHVGLNITNSTNITVSNLDIAGVSGDGIGLMVEHSGPLTADGVTVRYADKGVFLVHTDDVQLNDVNVDWCQRYGVQLSYCDGVDITHLSATQAGTDGLYAGYCRGLRVEDAALDMADECGAYLTHSPTSLTNVTAWNCGQYGVRAALYSTFMVGCDLSYNGIDGFLSLDQGGAGLTDCILEGNGGDGVAFVAAKAPFLKGCMIKDNMGAGVRVHYESRAADVLDCDIRGNGWGVVLNGEGNMSGGSSAAVRDCYIHNNTLGGALNWLDNSSNLDARYCWWGNNTGPYNETRNREGSGDYIEGGVRFKPWLKLGNLPPIIGGPRDITVVEEEVESFFYSAGDWDDDPNRITFHLEGAPGNVTIGDVSGTLVVAPDDPEVGTHAFHIGATDARGGVGRLRINLTVLPVNDPPEILVPEEGFQLGDDDPIDIQLEAVDPDNEPWELSWSLLSGPDFLSIRDDGLLEGTTSWDDRGRHNITVRVEDGAGGEDVERVQVWVVPHFEPIRISGLSTSTAYEGLMFYSDILVTHDEEADLEWSIITNCSWLVLHGIELQLRGLPGPIHVGTVAVELTASDQFGHEATHETTIEVIAVNDPPYWVGLPEKVIATTEDWDMDLAPYVRDDDDPVRSLTFSYERPDRRLDLQGSFLVGEFREGDRDLHITVLVRDPHGEWDEANLTIKVDIPEEPGPSYTVSALAPWLLVALVAALAAGIILSQRERRRREGEEGV